jgi:glycosyltransferase 2 family protein
VGASTPDGGQAATRGWGPTARTSIALAIGLGLIAWLLQHAGLDQVREHVAHLGWGAAVGLVPYALIAYFDARGWACTLSDDARRKVSMARIYFVRLAGEAVNSITPTAAVGGEPIKAMLLRRCGVSGAEAVASIVITKTALTLTQSLFVVIGFAALFEYLELHWVSVGGIAGLLGLCAGFGVVLVRLQRRGPVTTLWRWLHRVLPRARFVARLREVASSIDERLQSFYQGEHASFYWASVWHMCGWLVGVWEVHLLMQLIAHPITWQQALIIEALAQPIRATAIVVPGAFGTQELGGAAVCTFLGIPEAAAVTFWLLRRGREFVFDGIGLLFLLPQSARGVAA